MEKYVTSLYYFHVPANIISFWTRDVIDLYFVNGFRDFKEFEFNFTNINKPIQHLVAGVDK